MTIIDYLKQILASAANIQKGVNTVLKNNDTQLKNEGVLIDMSTQLLTNEENETALLNSILNQIGQDNSQPIEGLLDLEIGFLNKENIFIIQNKIKGKIMALTLSDIQSAVGTLSFTDAKGASVPVANETITATTDDATIATVAVNADGTITVTAVAVGTTNLNIDAKDPDGADVPFDAIVVDVVASDATGGQVTFAAPTP